VELSQDMLIFAIAQAVMLIGFLGLIVPIIPGLVLMWLAALGYGVATGWGGLAVVLFAIITVLMLFGTVVDNLLMGLSAHRGGASWTTLLIAFAAGLLGTLILPPFGGIITAPLAVLLLEYRRLGDWDQAWKALVGLVKGWGLAYVVRLMIGLLLMGLWWLWAWFVTFQGG
jgi:uncharacterized protein